jgi:hypothetical protein
VRFAGAPSWQIRVDRWPWELELALWIRAVERIPVPAGGVVPGRLDLDPIPPASEPPVDPVDAVDGWARWWDQVLDIAPPDPRAAALSWGDEDALEPAAFPWLSPWPSLHRVVCERSHEAARWQNERKRAAIDALRPAEHMRDGQVVRDLEKDLRRAAPPFECDLVVLPVCEDEVRKVADGRHLVPERVYTNAAWPAVLTGLLRPLFG